ncbi:TPA: hypothetical protein I1462_000594 [Staphylococcus pseudintermedius]|uniref:hypothetical protein n=1 Tax=Staphylococcus pseudintermedius TaxID=283734 RepID=UPI000AA035F5|nr:hypothetical protein [Staphylococcus pseudintermedius]EGQ0366915.1 hypothetical protein [Staphylococcus pseudintermedius]EGQ2704579.1 hypothetical protein [Staphylococcus pseudintermedius]EGQ2806292.1 hypothetical protein [Staphylococcus pseudintermedius]EGQ2813588.1 hypothetical protein [Staphylococcus pseudintermedius]EGQ3066699.1 hypothetical protein [Staphylococcus pseudintermedius]
MRVKRIALMFLLAYFLFTTFDFHIAGTLYMFSAIVVVLEAEYKAVTQQEG